MSGGRQGGQADRLRYLLHEAEAAMWHVVHGMGAWHGLTLLTTSQDVCGGRTVGRPGTPKVPVPVRVRL